MTDKTNDLADAIMRRIDGAIVDLMPEEELRKMIDSRIVLFTQDRQVPKWEGSRETTLVPAPLNRLVDASIQRIAIETVQQMMKERDAAGRDLITRSVQEAVTVVVRDNFADVMQQFVLSMIGSSLQFGHGAQAVHDRIKASLSAVGIDPNKLPADPLYVHSTR